MKFIAGRWLRRINYEIYLSKLKLTKPLIKSYKVFNINGSLILQNNLNSNYSKINISSFSKGVYQGVLSENDITELESLMESENAGVAKSALALLILNNPEYSYHEVVKPVIIEEPPLMQPYNNNNEFEEEENQYFNIYPNPSYDFITIKYQTYDKYKSLHIDIKNAEGRSVMKKKLEVGNNEEMINTTNLAPGMYQVMIYGDNNLIETIKITKLK